MKTAKFTCTCGRVHVLSQKDGKLNHEIQEPEKPAEPEKPKAKSLLDIIFGEDEND